MPLKTLREEIEKEIMKESWFVRIDTAYDDLLTQDCINFIYSALDRQLAEIIKLAECIKKKLCSHEDEKIVVWKDGYNQAISDLITKLKENSG